MTYPSELSSIINGLSKEQKDYYKAISWLTNPMGPRGSGRSYLMALAFIEHSLSFKIWVKINNHENNTYSTPEMLRLIINIVGKTKKLSLKIREPDLIKVIRKNITSYIEGIK